MELQQFNSIYKLSDNREWLSRFIQGKETVPICIEMDITNKCNYSCTSCSWKLLNKEMCIEKDYSQAKFEISELVKNGIKAMILTGGGEPLLHTHASKIIKYAYDIGLRVGLLTNGTLLNQKNIPIIAKCCDWIRIHLDAIHESYFTKIHNSSYSLFKTLRGSVSSLCQFDTINVGIGSTINEDNFSEIEHLIGFAHDCGCDYFQAKHDYNQIGISSYQCWWLNVVVPFLRKMEDRYTTNNFKIHFTISDYTKRHNVKGCHIHSLCTAITSSSEYVFCKLLRDRIDFSAGNLKNSSLKDILVYNASEERNNLVTPRNCGKLCSYRVLNEYLEGIKNGNIKFQEGELSDPIHSCFF